MPSQIVRVVKQYFCLGVLLTCLPAPLWAQADDYTAHGVPIEITGTSAVDARNQAMVAVEEKAFRQLVEERAPTEAPRILSSVNRAQISLMVAGTEIEQEKFSGNQYRALMSVSFSPNAVRKLLGATQPLPAPVTSAPAGTSTLVIPVYTVEGKSTVILDDNPWKHAWDNATRNNQLLNLSLPLGDLEDIAVVTASNAAQGTFATFSSLAQKYHAKDFLIADARLEHDAMNNSLILRITLKQLSPSGTLGNTLLYRGQPGQDEATVLANATQDVLAQLGQRPQQELLAGVHDVSVTVPYNQLSDWVRAKARIKKVSAVERISVNYIGSRFANLTLSTHQSQEELVTQLQNNGFTTSVSPNGVTILRLVGL